MASSNEDRGRCLRYKSDLQKKSLLPPTSTMSAVISQRSGSMFILASASLLLLLLAYAIYRRRRNNKFDENDTIEQRHRSNFDLKHDSSEYRLTVANTLPTIVEENPVSLTPSTSKHKFSPTLSLSTSSQQTTDNYDSTHSSSSPSLRQRKSYDDVQTIKLGKDNTNDVDDFVQIASPLSSVSQEEQEQSSPSRRRRSQFDQDTTKIAEPILVDSPRPVIFRKFCTPHVSAIKDDYTSLDEIDQAVKEVGLVRSQLIFGIDYTISNLETGKHSFNGLSLHHIEPGLLNPYQSVITIIGRTLEKFDSDKMIPAFGFGDRTTLDRKIFPLRPDGTYCKGFLGVLEAYNKITPKVRMSGPTNFAPLIKEAIRIVKKTRQYHILVIVADGQVTNERQTKDAIVEASNYPLSIVMIGVGDGPWDMMEEFDDSLPTRQFDNFQFVNYNSVVQATKDTDSDFALHALMEIPSQYASIKQLGLLKDT